MDNISHYYFIGLLIICLIELIIIFVIYKKNKQANITEDDVLSLVNEGHQDGNILASEAEMIHNIFEFSDTDVKDIMTHRKNIIALDGELTLQEALSFINENHFSRYPVYVEDFDNIIGILHIKDVLSLLSSDMTTNKIKDLREYLSPAEFVPETHGINSLFANMQIKKQHMILVVDEYGQTSGLLSMEDILEEIVGNIEDEHDEIETNIVEKSKNTFIMDGSTPLDEVAETIGFSLSDDFETLNGYLISLYGKIPEEGAAFRLEDSNFIYDISGVSNNVIQEVIVRKKNV